MPLRHWDKGSAERLLVQFDAEILRVERFLGNLSREATHTLFSGLYPHRVGAETKSSSGQGEGGARSGATAANGVILARADTSSVDESAFISARPLAVERGMSLPQLNKLLKKIPETQIRRRKPSPQRLELHAGDWHRYFEEQDRQRDEAFDKDVAQEMIEGILANMAEAQATKRRRGK